MKFRHSLWMMTLCLFLGLGVVGVTGCGGPGSEPTGETVTNDENAPENASEDYIEGEENIGK